MCNGALATCYKIGVLSYPVLKEEKSMNFLGPILALFGKWTPFAKRIESVTLAFFWQRKLNIIVRTNSILSFFRSIIILRLGITYYITAWLDRTTLGMQFPDNWHYRNSCFCFFFNFSFMFQAGAVPPAGGVPPTGGTPPVAQPGAAFGMVSLSLYSSPFFIQNPTHAALIYSPQQDQVYPWCPNSQLCMGSPWWGRHLELPQALVYRWVSAHRKNLLCLTTSKMYSGGDLGEVWSRAVRCFHSVQSLPTFARAMLCIFPLSPPRRLQKTDLLLMDKLEFLSSFMTAVS